MSKYHADEQQLQKLQTGNEQEWKAFYEDIRQPFRLFFLKKTQLDVPAVTELLHEAMVIFHRKVTSGSLQAPLSSKLSTFLIGIGKILARKKALNQKYDWEDDIPEEAVQPEIDQQQEREANARLVDQLLAKIGSPCNEILELFFIKGFAVDAVMETMGLPSEGATRKKKFDCLKKMRSLL